MGTSSSSLPSSSPAPPAVVLAVATRCTVVKQMLYSWMMDGYRELKSSSKMYLS